MSFPQCVVIAHVCEVLLKLKPYRAGKAATQFRSQRSAQLDSRRGTFSSDVKLLDYLDSTILSEQSLNLENSSRDCSLQVIPSDSDTFRIGRKSGILRFINLIKKRYKCF